MASTVRTPEPLFRVTRALIVADFRKEWIALSSALQQDGIDFEMVGTEALNTAAASCAERDDTVAIVDFWGDATRGMAAVAAFRRAAERVPVIVIVQSPPLDLVRRLHQSGVFFVALDPVSPDELRTVLRDAYDSVRRGSAQPAQLVARPNILIIDDDADFRASTQALLESEGFAVTCARDGREGVAAIKRTPPDLIVLDVMMEHDWAGYEVNWAVKYGDELSGSRSVPILMVSSVPLDPATRFGLATEAPMVTPDSYLTKPLDVPRFLETVRGLLRIPTQPAEARAAP